MEKLLEIGQIVNTHGLRGDVKVMPWCDDPELFHELEYVLIDEKSKDAYLMHPETQALLEKLLKMLCDEGEDAVFSYIKRNILRKRWKKS